ncbi:MAG: serpin family protein [Bacteroidales bacterium]
MKTLTFLAVLVISCLSCSKELPTSEEMPRPAPPHLYPGFTVSNQFGLKLYGAIYRENPESNLCVSPVSVRTALSMLANGTSAEDMKEILQALDLSEADLPSMNEDYKNLTKYLILKDPKVTFESANSFWYQAGISIVPTFRNDLTEYYNAGVYPVDFNWPGTLNLINNWVSDKTHGKIKEIVTFIPPNTVMNLTNAIYFNGEWTYKFDRKKNKPWGFSKLDRTEVDISVMENNQAYRFYSHPAWYGLEMPYGNGEWAMYAFMPHQTGSLDKLTDWLIDNWDDIRTRFVSDKTIKIYFPQFIIEKDFDLIPLLQSLGIRRVFRPGANFSRMMDQSFAISAVIHKTYINVNEDGTEAAGVTSMWGIMGSPYGLFFDHPFTYVIAERSTGLILFIGQVMDPSVS